MLIKFLKGQVTAFCNKCRGTQYISVSGHWQDSSDIKGWGKWNFSLLKLVNQHICLFPFWLPAIEQAQ